MTPPAASSPHGNWKSPIMSCRPTGQVRVSGPGREHQGEQELVPGADGDEHGGGQEAVAGDRQRDPPHRPKPGAAVDAGGLLQFARQVVEEALHEPDEHRQQEAGIGERQTELGVEQARWPS